MSTKFKTVITTAGAAKLAAATVPGGKKVNLSAMAVGDGNGKLPVPDASQTQLVHEVWRHALNKVSVDNKNKNYIVAELVVPPEVGGFWMRELGLYDDAGTLIAVSNMAESYKPELAEGSGRAQTCRMVIILSNVASVELSIDASTVMATQDYVDDKIAEHEQSRSHPDATLTEKGFTQLSSATNSTSEKLAATPKAVKTAYDLANGKYTAQDATTARKGLVQLSSATNSTSESLAATPKAVKDAHDNAEKRLQKDQNGADILDRDLFVHNIGAARAYSTAIDIGGDNGNWTTAQFIGWLESQGAFNHPYWMCKGTWAYAKNKVITDTGCGYIQLAGAVVEVMGARNALTIRVTTPTTVSVANCVANAQFIYVNHGDNYSPGWRRDFNRRGDTVDGEIISTSPNGFRIAYGNYGFFIRNDGGVTYFLLTAAGDRLGTWSNLRPLRIDNTSGAVTVGNGLSVNGGAYVSGGNITASGGQVIPGNYGNFDARFQMKNTASKAANGWHKDTSTGIITQWGRLNSTAITYANVTFPVAFPTACVSISNTVDRTGYAEGSGNWSSVRSVTRTGFQAGMDRNGSYWIAIGY
ncbi:phage tail protein [Salmonella enterica]